MTEENQNTDFYTNNTVGLLVTVYDDNNNLKDLTASTITWLFFDGNTDEILITKTTASGITIVDAINGLMLISIEPEDTRNIKPANWYKHEVFVVDGFGNESTVTTGYIEIKKSVI